MDGRTVSSRKYTRRAFLGGGAALAAAPVLSACGGGGSSNNGVTTVVMWHGQSDQGKATLEKLVANFNKTNKKIKVKASSGGVLADSMLEKITTALAGGEYPDIAYIFGPDIASLARTPRVADLSTYVKRPGINWKDFWPAARDAVTVQGKPRAFPSLIDNLCVAYNKKLFAAAGIPEPKAGWTWDDYVDIAKKLTDQSKGIFGTGWPGAGDEDTVWRLWPLIWDLGGDVVSSDGKTVGFDNDSGLKALTTVNQLGKDKSLYVDTKPGSSAMYQVFINNKMGMIPTGPWELPDLIQNKVDYDVAPLPSYSGKPMTITGPDTWTIFDNGSDRIQASVEFLSWLTAGDQDIKWAEEAGSLPLRNSTAASSEWKQHVQHVVGLNTFTDALSYARARPTITSYPKISEALGQAIVQMLLDKSSPKDALSQAVQQANSAIKSG